MYKSIEIGKIEYPNQNELGGKVYWLDNLKKKGFRIPRGFVIEKTIFYDFLEQNGIDISGLVEKVFRYDRVRSQVYEGTFTDEQVEYLKNIFDALNKPIIVRSSGNQEDSSVTSCAGLYTSIPQVQDFPRFLEVIKLCWIASFSEMLDQILGEDREYGISLLVQEEYTAELGGVAFSVNPVTNNYNEVVIESSSIGPTAAVEGKGMIQRYQMPRDGEKDIEEMHDQVRRTVLQIEEIMGKPVDMEWLFAKNQLYIIQSRPVTTVSLVEKVAYLSVDNPETLKHNLKNCTKINSRWLDKKDIVRQVCLKSGVKVGKFFYYWKENDMAHKGLLEVLQQIETPMLELMDGENAHLVDKEKAITVIQEMEVPVIRIGESVPTFIAGFSTIVDDTVYFEAVKGGFSGFYKGDFEPTKYVVKLDGTVVQSNIQTFTSEYVLESEMWSKKLINPYRLEFSSEQIEQIIQLTKVLTEAFNEVRTEWILNDNGIYLFDVTIEHSSMETVYCDGNVISAGKCDGVVSILDNINIMDPYAEHISIRMGQAFNEIAEKKELNEFIQTLNLKNKIIVCDYPKENLALLLGEVKGFVFERGSLLCHFGIILRERGIPALIMKDAKKILNEGMKLSIHNEKIKY